MHTILHHHGSRRPFFQIYNTFQILLPIILCTILTLLVYAVVCSIQRCLNRTIFSTFRTLSGPMIRDIIDNIKDWMAENGKGRKAKIYSGVKFSSKIRWEILIKFFNSISMKQPLLQFCPFSMLTIHISLQMLGLCFSIYTRTVIILSIILYDRYLNKVIRK